MTIGIIAAKNSQIDLYSDWLTSADIDHEQVRKDSKFSMARPGVKVASAYSSKGLEYNAVIIPMFAEGYFPYSYMPDNEEEYDLYMIRMRNLVYVSMTRARNILVITWWGNGGSRFIAEMDPELYETEGSPFRISVPAPVKFGTKPGARENRETGSSSPLSQIAALLNSEVTLKSDNTAASDLITFLKNRGIEVIDKRPKGGSLWIVGGKELNPLIVESKGIFGALWTFCPNGGGATGYRTSWFTKCKK